jgi:uncharacterized membrane protein
MVTNEKVIKINRPIEEVFAYVSDLQNGTKWQSGLVESKRITEGKLGIGSQFTGVRKFMGRRMESIIQFTTYELNKKIAFKSISGASPFEQSFLFETTTEGTRLTTVLDLQTSGLMFLAKPMIASGLKREMDTNFANLKVMLESWIPVAAS